MKTCCTWIAHVLLVGSVGAAHLRRHPGSPARNVAASLEQSVRLAKNVPAAGLPAHTITLRNYKGVQYTAPVTLNSQTLMAVYDTGSFEIMAMSNMCTVCQVPSPMTKYDNRTSTTFAAGPGAMEDHHFAGGWVRARQDFETVHIGDIGNSFSVPAMPFWQVVSTDMQVWTSNKAQFTAIVGLGHRTTLPDAVPSGIQPKSLIERTGTQRFAICLQRGVANPGFITFNPQLALPTLQQSSSLTPPPNIFRRVPVVGKHHWAVPLNQVAMAGGTRCGASQPCVAIIDSGTSLLGVPPMAADFILPLMNSIKPDCSNVHQLPDLTFNLGGHELVMPPSAYVIQFRTNAGQPRKCLPAFTDFAMTSPKGAVWILGMPFLRQFYTVFDRTEPSIYVAAQGANCQPVATSANPMLFNSTGLSAMDQEPTFADVSEATSPTWASGITRIEL